MQHLVTGLQTQLDAVTQAATAATERLTQSRKAITNAILVYAELHYNRKFPGQTLVITIEKWELIGDNDGEAAVDICQVPSGNEFQRIMKFTIPSKLVDDLMDAQRECVKINSARQNLIRAMSHLR